MSSDVRQFSVLSEPVNLESRFPQIRRLLVRNLRRIGVPPDQAEDIAQDVLPKLALCRATDETGVAAYGTKIGKRMWFRSGDEARRGEVSVRDWRVHESLLPRGPEERLDAREKLFEWEPFAATLPANVRAAAEVCFIEGWTQSEAAARFGVPLTTIDWWLRSVRAGFREWLRARRAFKKEPQKSNGGRRRTR